MKEMDREFEEFEFYLLDSCASKLYLSYLLGSPVRLYPLIFSLPTGTLGRKRRLSLGLTATANILLVRRVRFRRMGAWSVKTGIGAGGSPVASLPVVSV